MFDQFLNNWAAVVSPIVNSSSGGTRPRQGSTDLIHQKFTQSERSHGRKTWIMKVAYPGIVPGLLPAVTQNFYQEVGTP